MVATFATSSAFDETLEISSSTASNIEPATKSLLIPIITSSDSPPYIEIFPDELVHVTLPTLLSVLRDEIAPIAAWADAGVLLLSSSVHRPADALTLLTTACQELESKSFGNKEERVRLLAATGIAYLAQQQHLMISSSSSNKESSKKRLLNQESTMDEFRILADAHLNRATKLDPVFPMTWIGKALFHLSEDKLDQAKFFLETTRRECGDVLPALLGLACTAFKEHKYLECQQLFGRAIELYPISTDASAAIRVGFGMACYKLGQVDRARAAFSRARDLDGNNVEAMVGLAVLDLAHHTLLEEKSTWNELPDDVALETKQRIENAIKLMSIANMRDNTNAMVQNHLANHYFWKWTPCTGIGGSTAVTVDAEKGSTSVKWSSPGHITLEPGDRIRIGLDFETTVLDVDEDEDDTDDVLQDNSSNRKMKYFRIKDPFQSRSQDGLQLWRKDFDRVTALARGAYSGTSVQEIQAESLFHLARVYHIREDIENAHKCYQRACALAPNFAPARFGLAQTLIWDETYDEAAAHLRLVLGTCPHATDAYALLGMLEVKIGKGEHKKEAFSHFRKAIDLDPLNADLIILEALAFQQNQSDYPAALERYRKAMQLMEAQGTEAAWEISTNMGVLCHETKQYEEAATHYGNALRALDNHESSTESSLDVREEVIRHPDNWLFWTYIDCDLTVEKGSESDAVSSCWNIVEGNIGDTIITGDQIMIGNSFETEVIGLEDSGIIRVKGQAIDDSTSHERYRLSVKRSNNRLSNPSAVSVAFNIARLHEAAGRILAAVELHKAILKRHPSYVNSYLRLACIARDCGSLKDCSEWLKSACAVAPGNPEVLTLVGNLHLSLCDWAPAQSVFDQLLLQKIPNVEAYSMLCLGNIYFNNLKTPKRYSKHLQYAADWYKRILNRDKTNAYAANGIGTIIAEKGELLKAKEIFNRVREVSGDSIPDVLLNLGHVYLALSKHPEALQMYQSYINRSRASGSPITSKSQDDDDVQVLIFIAFAYFDWAKQTESSNNTKAVLADDRYKSSLEYIEKALKKAKKDNVLLRYNWCMVKLQSANCVLQKPSRNIRRTAREVQIALIGLEESLSTVQMMLQLKQEGKKILIPTSVLTNFVNQCRANMESAKSHLNQEIKREADARELEKMHKEHEEIQQLEEDLRRKVQEEKELNEQRERDNRARLKMEKVSTMIINWEEAKVKDESSAKKKSKGVDVVPEVDEDAGVPAEKDLFDESDNDSDEEMSRSHSKGRNLNNTFVESVDGNEHTVDEAANGKDYMKPSDVDLFGDDNDDIEQNEEGVSLRKRSLDNFSEEGSTESSKKRRLEDSEKTNDE